jgi:hypothetical protein
MVDEIAALSARIENLDADARKSVQGEKQRAD